MYHFDTNLIICTVLEQTRVNPKEWQIATKPLVSAVLVYGRKNRPAYILYLLYVKGAQV